MDVSSVGKYFKGGVCIIVDDSFGLVVDSDVGAGFFKVLTMKYRCKRWVMYEG